MAKIRLILSLFLLASFDLSSVFPTTIALQQNDPVAFAPNDDVTSHLQLQKSWPRNRHQQHQQIRFVTKTVSGFMDFVTTVGNTVMVFTPAVGSPTSTPAQSTLIVTPTRVLPRFDDNPTIGIEGLFQDFQRPAQEFQRPPPIQPTSVKREQNLIDLDAGIEDNQSFEAFGTKPLRKVDSDSRATKTHVASTTLTSNFIIVDGQPDVGLVTATGGTLIANGVTTVHTTRVFGTYLNGGNYAQIVQSTAKIFEDDIKATPVVGFAGSVQHVTERPGIGLEVAESGSSEDDLPLESLFDKNNIADDDSSDEELDNSPTGIASRIQQRIALKKSTQNDFKARLKSRFDRFKSRTQDQDTSSSQLNPSQLNIGRGSVSQISLSNRSGFGRSTTGFRSSRERTRQSSEATKVADDFEDSSEDVSSVEDAIGARSSRQRFRSRIRPAASNIRPVSIKLEQESVEELLSGRDSSQSSSFKPRFGSRSRFRDRNSSTRRQESRPTAPSLTRPERPVPARNFLQTSRTGNDNTESSEPTLPSVSFKKFNRFSRPDIRQSLLEKILGKGKGKNTIDPEELENAKNDIDTSLDESIEAVEVNEIDTLQTTLKVSTVYPEDKDKTSTYLEVATIRSPYSFAIEEGMSTRFITVTRTFTNTLEETIAPSATKPLFQTETIPAPENILTSSGPVFDSDTDLSSSIETLPAVVIASSSAATPALKTITETFSSTELMLKTSILPIVLNGKTKLHTLTQSYYVTRLIEAVKTLPPLEFIPTSAFTDFDNVLEEAGSEKREQLLPGELEFSDQDDFSSLEGPHEIRVKPPPGFQDELSLLGSKFDSLNEEKPDPLQLQPSIGQFNAASLNPFANLFGAQLPPSTATPTLPNFNPLAGLTQEQIQQLALLQYLKSNPVFAGLGFGLPQGPQVITTSTPVYKTETMYSTSTIPLFLGAKKFFTTLTQAIGVTTKTEYETTTQTVNAANNPNGLFGGFNFGQANNPLANNPANPGVNAGFVVTSEAVTKDTVVPSTVTKEIKITFRNTPTVTTLTSTTMVSSQITSYVTKTVRAQPTLSPGAGLAGLAGFNPLAALLG